MTGGLSSRTLHVAVLCGGDSAEREVSLASGICVAAALEKAGHAVRSIDPAQIELVRIDWRQFDACFIALHGGAGEGGRVQALLESLGVPYTGSGPRASRLGMSKSASKRRFAACGVPTPAAVSLSADWPIHALSRRAAALGFPLIVKPDGQGSSLGVHLVRGPDDFDRAVAEAQFYDRRLLAEKYIAGRELTVAVLGRRALPLLEIVVPEPLFSFQAKYHDVRTAHRFDTGLPAALVGRVKQTAVVAASALGTSDLVRVDLRLDAQEQPWVLEVNTVPGMTETSLAPCAARQGGFDMPELCDRLVCEALARIPVTEMVS